MLIRLLILICMYNASVTLMPSCTHIVSILSHQGQESIEYFRP